MNKTPLSLRTHIAIVGMVNTGKSSLMNNLLEKDISIVSETPGTTTDPVTRAYESGSMGPVAFTDTAGFGDEGELGSRRMEKSQGWIDKSDIAILVTPADRPVEEREKSLLAALVERKIPFLLALSFADRGVLPAKRRWAQRHSVVEIDNTSGQGVETLRSALNDLKKTLTPELTPVEGIVKEGDLVLLVSPIDLAAPQGRLILPQVQTIRDLLDRDCLTLIVKERELTQAYGVLKERPALVITDSQAFHKVEADLPPDQKLTSFSILFARKKGDLFEFVRGIRHLKKMGPEARVLVMESCSHHRQADDIGTVKIPRLYRQLVSPRAQFSFSRTLPPPEELSTYQMIIHCAGCMQRRSEILLKIEEARAQGVLITNYGLFLAWVNGLLPRVLEPLPEIHAYWRDS